MLLLLVESGLLLNLICREEIQGSCWLAWCSREGLDLRTRGWAGWVLGLSTGEGCCWDGQRPGDGIWGAARRRCCHLLSLLDLIRRSKGMGRLQVMGSAR